MDKEEIKELDQKYHMNVYGERLPIAADRGEGVYLYDKNGDRYLDFAGGIAVNALGHNHPKITAAIQDQAEKLLHSSNLYYFEIQTKLAQLLVENSCADKVFFGNSGAEANEGALKLARKYFKQQGEDRYEVIVAKNSFHGRTLATVAATAQPKYQKPFTPLPKGFKEAPYNDVEAVKEQITDQTAAVMVEPIQGEGGVNPADKEYLQGLRDLCDQEGILLIFDEVQTGIGRTGSLFAYQNYGVQPDIFTLAKALGNGVPISCLLARGEAADAFEPGDHASTFGGNPLACRTAYTAVQTILDEGLVSQAAEIGDYFKEQLTKLVEKYAWMEEVRGEGLLLGVEVGGRAKEIMTKMRAEGILILVAGKDVLRFAPPLIISKAQVDTVITALDKVSKELE